MELAFLGLSVFLYNARNNISFSVSKIYFIYLMAPIDFSKDQNTRRGDKLVYGNEGYKVHECYSYLKLKIKVYRLAF